MLQNNISRFHRCMMDMEKKIVREYCYDKILEMPENCNSYIADSEKDKFVEWVKKRTNSRYRFAMFTINFKPEADIEIIKKAIKKATKKCWIENWKYCWECTKNDDNLHIHMKVEIKDGKNSYECKREMYNTFKNVVGNKMHVNVRYSNRTDCFDKYLDGLKDDKMKECMPKTYIMRKRYEFADLYEKDGNIDI